MKNGLLRVLVVNANDSLVVEKKETLPITLSVNGQLISGELISRSEFFTLEQNATLKYHVDIIDAEIVQKKGEIPEIPMEEIQFLHLKNAAYWVNGVKVPSSQTSIIVNIDSVDAFNIGMLQCS
ncbi:MULTISPECIES: hypothetical protein [unclassified Acinetobacter]|uniref:hypothetical protein n=1 Tax=unclassified Acinetobacter TaxID=196816 RepID=UPI001C231007|nr:MULTISPECIES: hypothetical protein [unclassified Acinetobacter]